MGKRRDAAGPSDADYEEDMELTSEKDLLGESGSEEDFPCAQLPSNKKRQNPPKEQKHVPSTRKRRHSESQSAEERIEHAEKAIKLLK